MMKIAPLIAEMHPDQEIEPLFVRAGQHYDFSMSQVFLDDLQMYYPGLQPRRRLGQCP